MLIFEFPFPKKEQSFSFTTGVNLCTVRQFLFLFLISCTTAWSQENIINAEVLNPTKKPIENAHILNLSKNTATTSNALGKFSLTVSINDSIVISALGYKKRTLIINPTLINQKNLSFELTEQVEELEEVELIHYSKINAKDLGIISKDQKQHTPAEKKLYTLEHMTPLTGIVEGIINRLNGNVKRAKKLVELEKEMFALEEFKTLYNSEYITSKLNIPELYVDAFYWFCMEDNLFKAAAKGNNQSQIEFLLMEKAVSFLETIPSDTQ